VYSPVCYGNLRPSSPVIQSLLPLLNGSTAAPDGFLGPPFAGIFPSYGEVASDHHLDQEILSLFWASTSKADLSFKSAAETPFRFNGSAKATGRGLTCKTSLSLEILASGTSTEMGV
jgi:hypothetical protein